MVSSKENNDTSPGSWGWLEVELNDNWATDTGLRRETPVPGGAVAASVRKFQKELSGIVSLALLALLAHADKPLYGYQIAKELEGFGGGLPVKQGTLYPVLRSLEAGGLLSSEVEPSVTGPPRRYYRSPRKAGRRSACGRNRG